MDNTYKGNDSHYGLAASANVGALVLYNSDDIECRIALAKWDMNQIELHNQPTIK